jgi:hypothetical protein
MKEIVMVFRRMGFVVLREIFGMRWRRKQEVGENCDGF